MRGAARCVLRSVFDLASSFVVNLPSRARARVNANEINLRIVPAFSTRPHRLAHRLSTLARFAIASFRAQRPLADGSFDLRGRNTYRRHGARGALLERDTRDRLAEVDRVLSGDHVGGLSVASHVLNLLRRVETERAAEGGEERKGLSSSREFLIGHLDGQSQYYRSQLTVCHL